MNVVSIHRATIGTAIALLATSAIRADQAVDFNRDIRPILSDTCFQCHGPDTENRAADLRLDVKDSTFAERDGHTAVVPGDLKNSELHRRITSGDPDERMPPTDAGQSLSEEQIDLLTRWIEQGAVWQEHWSFVAPQRPDVPNAGNSDWCHNAIDHFVLARMEAEQLTPSPPANKATLIRRVSLDLTGLPPTPEETDAFLADRSPEAWERVVDRLLRSPRYGEHMAVRWLDLSRYADTSGYQTDGPRSMWRWRDWVINAYNNNMPFDQFTLEQIAGDLLQDTPEPGRTGLGGLDVDETTLDRLIATGFNRNHRGNAEGGVDPDEYQVEYVVDRVDTTATVWLGLTLGCARCHDHKYDPISQEEFYRVFAFFNNVPENGRAIKEGNSPPYIKAPTPEQRRQLAQLDADIALLENRWQQHLEPLRVAQTEWEATVDSSVEIDWSPTDGLISHFPLDANADNSVPPEQRRAGDNSSSAVAPSSKTIPHTPGAAPEYVDGRLRGAARFDGAHELNGTDVARLGYFDAFTLSAWVKSDGDGTILSRMLPVPQMNGYSLDLHDGHVQVNLVQRWLDDCIRIETQGRIAEGEWHHIAVTYDGTRQAAGITVFIDGRPSQLTVHFDFLNQTFEVDAPLRIGHGNQNFHGTVDDVRIYDRTLSEPEVLALSCADSIAAIAGVPPEDRSDAHREKLAACFLHDYAPDLFRTLHRSLIGKRQERASFVNDLPTVMIMSDSAPRETRLLNRGQFDQPKHAVEPGLPAVFPPLPKDAALNRLGFAQWLISKDHPLTARVAMNHFWQNFFGDGLVKTTEDFGAQGSRPTHPELLDWLAVEFMDSGWDIRHMLKTIVMSATYRQSTRVNPEQLERDPTNNLLARGPRFRLTAEMVRDQALAVGGLLHESPGGPSVRPYQPDGILKEIASDTEYVLAEGQDLYRRSLYTWWKRTVAPPTMTTFDATPREMCTVRRARTNTPLQALALMNDVTYVEAARGLAARMVREGGDSADDRVTRGFRIVLARSPSPTEHDILRAALDRYLDRFADRETAARELIDVGESVPDGQLNPTELAAYTAVASLILNLDEAVTRE